MFGKWLILLCFLVGYTNDQVIISPYGTQRIPGKFLQQTNFQSVHCFLQIQTFFFSLFSVLFLNHCHKNQSNQKQCTSSRSSPCLHVLLCTHYRPLQFFSRYFWKSKEIRVLQPIFPDIIVLVTMLMLLKFSLFLSSIVEALPFSPCAVHVLSYLAIAVAKRPLSSDI